MRSRRWTVVLVLLAAGACSGKKPGAPASGGGAGLASSPAGAAKVATPAQPGKASKTGKNGRTAAAGSASAAVDAGLDAQKPVEQVELETEEREANPYSESVTLRLSVTPSTRAVVLWGAKQMAQLEPGKMGAEIVRPRGSGPLDLEIKAEGYLPHHTRLYADRNDKVGARLYRVEEAPNIFGYNRSPEARQAEATKPGPEKP
jgi:hypothetical protein